MSYKDWRTSGLVYKQQDETIWIREHGTLNPYHWLGRCAKLEEGTDSLGDLSTTQRRNPRGGPSADVCSLLLFFLCRLRQGMAR